MSKSAGPLEVEELRDGLKIIGDLDAHSSPRLEVALRPFVRRVADDGGVVELHVDGVAFADSSGLRVILSATEGCRANGGDLVVVDPPRVLRRLFSVTGVLDHLTIVACDRHDLV